MSFQSEYMFSSSTWNKNSPGQTVKGRGRGLLRVSQHSQGVAFSVVVLLLFLRVFAFLMRHSVSSPGYLVLTT